MPAIMNFKGFSNLKSNAFKISELYSTSSNNLDVSFAPVMFHIESATPFYANRFRITNTV
jgi:hypothetical protein